MSGTKIINVVKDDSFDEVFDIFKDSQADEVVFILPKRSKVLNSEEQFQLVKTTADELGKKVALLSSNPTTVDMARQFEFEILQEKVVTPRKVKRAPAYPIARTVAVKAADNADDTLIPDDRDAFDPRTPSDETMGIVDKDDEEEKDVDEEEVLDDGALGIDAHLPADQADTGEVKEKEVAEPEDEIDEKDYQDSHEEFTADETSAPVRRAPVAQVARIKTASLIKKGNMKQPDLDRIAEVWQNESYQPGDTVWSQQRPSAKKPSLLTRVFSRKEQQFRVEKPQLAQVPRRKGRRLFLVTLLLLFGAGGFVYVKAGSAKIVITPLTKKLDFEMSANASDQFASVDSTFNKLPGQLFTVQKSVTLEFAATGQREVAQKAKGKITIYNTYGTTPQTLIATTRLTSTTGLVFRTLRTVTVPGTTVENGSVSPGSVEVEVIADKAGTEYNVGAGKWTIPAFQEKGDTARYQKFYGQSTAVMKDGISGMAKIVTEGDYTRAKDAVIEKLKSEIHSALEQEASGLKIPPNEEITISPAETSAEPDQAADTFLVTMHGSLRTMGFKESDMQTLIKDYSAKNYGLTVLPEKLDIKYTSVHLNEEKGILELTAQIQGNGYGQVQTAQISSDLVGKGEADIVGYLKQAEGVAEAKVLLSPFWVKKVPKNQEKVNVEVNYD